MTLARASLLAALLLSACGPGADAPAAGPKQEGGPVPAGTVAGTAPAISHLRGEYRVAGVDGEELNAPTGVTVSITEDVIDLARCAGFAWSYAFADDILQTERIATPADQPVCGVTDEVAQVGAALQQVNRVSRTAANGIEFSGGGRSVLLFSQ